MLVEQSGTIGGFTCIYSQRVQAGLIIDENSFYPSIMMNLVPIEYDYYTNGECVLSYDTPILINRDNVHTINRYYYYRVKYRHPSDCKLPMVIQKAYGSLVAVVESYNYDTDDSNDAVMLFGETIYAIVECTKGEVRIFEEIRYKPGYVHKEFIEYMYGKRQEAKANNDTVGDKFYKNVMNMCFGKCGQKNYPKNVFGTWETIVNQWSLLKMRTDVNQESIKITQLLTDGVPLYEMKYLVYD